MKNLTYIFLTGILIFGVSCQKDFLEMPVSGTTTVDSVFTTTVKAQSAIAQAYNKALQQGLPYQGAWNDLIQETISGALVDISSWGTLGKPIATTTGLTASGNTEDTKGYASNFTAIRQAYLVKENIDKVTDMTAGDKNIVKAEMQALVAYRYEQMFIMYGGVPIVTKTLSSTDDLNIPRAPLKAVLDSIVSWCDQSAAVLPSQWPAAWTGRMTKSAALAIKAKALMYAARPLFNATSPYLENGTNNNLICFGSYDANRWKTAAEACEAVITEAETNGGAQVINTGNPLADYGTATSTPGNVEVLLGFKMEYDWATNVLYNLHTWNGYAFVLTSNFLANYYKADGTDQSWPAIGEVRTFSDYTTRMNQMEPRFKADFWAYGISAWNNPNDNNWSNSTLFKTGWTSQNGCAQSVKFWYKAGTRNWFEFPIFRLAAYYLSAAEAYNEMGQPSNALTKLNVIRRRAGLPEIAETDQVKLRAIIQREWAVEFFGENYRLHDVKHWKLPTIGSGIIGGPMRIFAYNNLSYIQLSGNTNYQDYVIYQGFWAPRQYLNPFPQSEVNKGTVLQNPGY